MRKSTEHFSARRLSEFETLNAFCGCVKLFDDVLEICGDLHPLEHAVTIGRTRRAVTEGTELPYGAYLHDVPPFISMAFVQVPHSMWF